MTGLTYGIDVSAHQGPISWAQVGRSGLAQFAAVRLLVGRKPDAAWQANLAGAADHVALPMAYAVVGTRTAPADAADLLVNMVDRVASVDRVALVVDAENFADGSHPTMAQVHAFRDALWRLTGRWPCAYVPDWWLTRHGYRTDTAPWPWWPSRYLAQPWTQERLASKWPPLEHGFTVAGPWQFTSSGSVAGIAGRVDRNAYAGTLADLRALTLGGGTSKEDEMTEADWNRLRSIVREEVDEAVALVLRGDATHPDHLRAVRDDIAALPQKEPTP